MNAQNPTPADGMRTCPRCGAVFPCGGLTGSDTCWCAELPHVVPLEGIAFPGEGRVYEGCLCPDCLRQLIDARPDGGDLSE